MRRHQLFATLLFVLPLALGACSRSATSSSIRIGRSRRSKARCWMSPVTGTHVTSTQYTPVHIYEQYQPRLAPAAEAASIMQRVDAASATLRLR